MTPYLNVNQEGPSRVNDFIANFNISGSISLILEVLKVEIQALTVFNAQTENRSFTCRLNVNSTKSVE